MRWEIIEPKQLIEMIKALRTMAGEIKLKFTKDKLTIESFSDDNVSAVWFTTPITGDGEVDLCFKTEDLEKVLRKAKKLLVSFQNNKTTFHVDKTNHSLTVIDDEYVKSPPKRIAKGRVIVTINSKEFNEAVDDVTVFSTDVLFSTESGSCMELFVESNDKLNSSSKAIAGEFVKDFAKYNVDRLIPFKKVFEQQELINVSFSKDYPLLLYNDCLELVVAPKVDNQ